jgi:hypothetical protein
MTLACGSVKAGPDGKKCAIPSPPERLTSLNREGLHPMTFAPLSQGFRRDSFPARTTEVVQSGGLAKVPGPDSYRDCPVLSSGNRPSLQAGPVKYGCCAYLALFHRAGPSLSRHNMSGLYARSSLLPSRYAKLKPLLLINALTK